ncbi:chromosomal replication initiator protein DnaA [Capnocytophaga gingivalis]|jgi:chromosomal replication initiator protein dnaA|uniref:Chromosomal replication initiator protein DnaA n=1 Tax=Capnocytophaga gingivalis TaxID=1017 RepID=A0A250FMS6_9FLAO|nr:chromosomal replication initiator protein DnaA [Capnocytophaga gingivalis]RKW16560.1 MAG: chromosomal replication initiator protein DnaA [Capnocytophaga sp.]ATA85675.1 chromosomal replication initiation protein DnaA [Capnocytophaga gingivalis]EEK15740.1 chromosomal replication initiator protein DnaA [Capnocytophaga gingivalis ATCC 33624]MEB3013671.1 chromosomal replication initiator protein DnaA [Capnocytophaga gingivalis]MEB3041237.1 chromosomal replication initiator protein DnaA [Capnocyt
MNTDVRNIWENCLSFIKDNVTTDVYDVWFKPIEPVELTSDNTLVIMVPSMFFMEWIEDHYINLIWSALTKELGARPKLIYNIKMENNPNKTEQATEQLPSSNRKATSMEVLGYKQKPQQSYNPYVVPGLVEIEEVKVDSQLNPNKNFDTFIEGESNRLARSAGKAITERPGGTSFNPLFIFGGVGLGKTHLAHAIGNEIQEKHPKKRILYIEAEDFTKQYSVAAKNNNRTDFIHFYQQIDVLIIDNVQFFASKPGTQDVFFQIFNHLHQNGKQLILTSDKAPVDIQDVEQRLLSRFKWGLSAELQAPDYQMRKRILQAILYRDGVEMSEEIVDYIAQNVKTNIRELEGVNTSLMAEALFNKKEITLDLAKKAVDKIVKNIKKEITVEYIQEIVSEYFQLSIEELQSKTRKRHVVQARQLAMFFAKKYTKLSLANIGKSIGKRDHATVLHACKTVDNLNETDKQFRKFLSDLTTKINNR